MAIANFKADDILNAEDLDAALNYGDKLGGVLDNVVIGQTTPNAGSFTTLKAQTPPLGDNSSNVATTAFVQGAVGGISGSGGNSANLNSPAFTGTPTAPTAPANTNTGQLATTAYVSNALSGGPAGYVYQGNGIPGYAQLDGAGNFLPVGGYPWPSVNVIGPVVGTKIVIIAPSAGIINGLHVESPNAGNASSNSFTLSLSKNGVDQGISIPGSVSTVTALQIAPNYFTAAGDRFVFTVTAITGTIPNIFIQPV